MSNERLEIENGMTLKNTHTGEVATVGNYKKRGELINGKWFPSFTLDFGDKVHREYSGWFLSKDWEVVP